jgi:hypothetical protein
VSDPIRPDQNKNGSRATTAVSPTGKLEPELRSNGHSQVIAGAPIEINLVACFQSDPDRAGEGFDTAAGIDGGTRIAVRDAPK